MTNHEFLKNPSQPPVKTNWKHLETLWAWVFVAPCLLGLLVFTYVPTLASFLLSFSYWDLLGTPAWVGFSNYQRILADPNFWKVLSNTLVFVSVITLIEIPLALLLAVWIQGLIRGQGFFRAIYFFPYITPMISVALVFGWFYEPQNGLINSVLFQLGVLKAPIAWLQTPETAMGSVILLEIWKTVGYNTLLFLSGLQSLPKEINEASTLDGASSSQAFWKITLPLLTPTLFMVMLVTLIHGV
jgi:multiple sugar transport system permease protein